MKQILFSNSKEWIQVLEQNVLWNPVSCISAGSARGVETRPGPAARASAAAGGADTAHENGEPGTACPLNRTDSVCGAASTGLKFTWVTRGRIWQQLVKWLHLHLFWYFKKKYLLFLNYQILLNYYFCDHFTEKIRGLISKTILKYLSGKWDTLSQ